jgi:hypothetical protein
MTTLTIDQLGKWYNKRLANKSKDFVKKAEKSYKKVERALKDIEALSKDLLDASEEDDSESQGISSRFAMKISDIVANFYVDKRITHANTEAMVDEIQNFIKELWGAGSRWIKRMDKKHKATIKSLDVYMKELMKEMNVIGKYLYEFNWIKDLERIENRIDTLRDLTFGKDIFQEQIRQVKLKIDSAKTEYDQAKSKHAVFMDSSNVAELLSLDEESERLAALIRMQLNILKKPIKKLMQHDTGVRIGPTGMKALTDYFEEPLVAIVNEPDGTPGLLEGLDGLKQAIEGGGLKVKDRLARRAVEEIEAIRNGSIQKLQDQAKEIQDKRERYAGSDVYTQNERLQNNLTEATKNLEYHMNDLLKIGDDIKRQIEKVEEFRARIESEILEHFTEKVIIKIDDLGLEPLLQQCSINREELLA